MSARRRDRSPSPEPSGSGSALAPASSPLYLQVKQHLIQRVLSGEWKPGERLPNEGQIAEGYGLSVGTVRKAIGEMVSEGLVARWAGRGTFVNSHIQGAHRPFRFNSIHTDDGRRLAGQPTTYVDWHQGEATERAAAGLGVDAGDPVTVVMRLRWLDGQPVLLETTHLPEARCPDAHALLGKQQPDSIYQLLEQSYDILVTQVEEKVRARAADEREAELLAIPAGVAVLEIERTAFSLGGERVEWRTMVCETGDHHYMNQRKR